MQSRQPAVSAEGSRSPFVADPRAGYFEPPSRLQLLDKLQHLIRYSDFLLLIEGRAGSGKTTLLAQLRLEDAGRLARLTLRSDTDSDRVLRQIAEVSGLDGNADLDPLERLHTEARLLEDAGQCWLLLIDNAECLSDEALDLLVNFQRSAARTLRLVLAASALSRRLEHLGLAEALDGYLHTETLQAFTPEEAEDYLHRRYPALEILDSRRLEKLVRHSDRLPGTLETLAGKALRLNRSEAPLKMRATTQMLPLGVVALVLLSLVSIAGWIWWQPQLSRDPGERRSVPLAVPALPTSDASQAETVRIEEAAKSMPTVSMPESAGSFSEPALAATFTRSLPAEALPEPAPAERVAEALPEIAHEPATADSAHAPPEPLAVNERIGMQASLPAIVMDTQEEPVAVDAVEQEYFVAQPQSEPVVADGRSPATPARLAPQLEADAPEPAAQPSIAMAAPALAQEQEAPPSGEGGLLQWPDRGYTLQMLGARKAATIDKFIARQADPDAFHYFSTLYKGKPWHVVIYGRYDSRQSAAAAAQSLPAELRELQPWARSIQSVKADILKKRP